MLFRFREKIMNAFPMNHVETSQRVLAHQATCRSEILRYHPDGKAPILPPSVSPLIKVDLPERQIKH